MPCRHPDIRQFDGLRCCLSCGQAVLENLLEGEEKDYDYDMSYKYRRLSYELGQEIRLVILHPGEEKDRLVCTIIHVNLLDEPQYEAVSYTWKDHTGDASFTGNLYCREKAIPITANCEAALRRFRERYASRHLWIDAICIDQQNETEKNHQVQVMSKIYSMASQVLAFIGLGDHQQRKSFHRVIKHLRGEPQPLIFYQCGAADSDLRVFLKMPYWSRVWVTQEIALARRVTVVLGNESVHWMAHEVDAMLQLCREEGQVLPGVLAWKPEVVGGEQDLLEALHRSRTCAASDPRDKVFALLGIAHKQFSAAIPIDYSSNALDLFKKVAILYIQNMKCLQILKHTLGQDVIPSRLPSWVPDWAAPIQVELLPALFNAEQIQKFASTWYGPPQPQPLLEHTSATHTALTESCIDMAADRVGLAVHEKEISGHGIHENTSSSSTLQRPLRTLTLALVVRAHYLDSLIPGRGRDRAFGNDTLCESCSPGVTVKTFDENDQCHDDDGQKSESGEVSAQQQRLFELHCSKIRAPLEKFETRYSRGFIRQTARFNSTTSRIFKTSIAFAAQRGSENIPRSPSKYEIWLLESSDVPFLLQWEGSHYCLIGECYLHGAALPFPCSRCGRDAQAWPMRTRYIEIW